MNAVLYIHGKGGSAAESAHYLPLFPDCTVVGLDYQAAVPWEAGSEIRAAIDSLNTEFDGVILIANSIGAFFSMHADLNGRVRSAYFISPIVDMELLITDMMHLAGVTEEDLEKRGEVPTGFGENLSWAYLQYVRSHPIQWTVPTQILYGSNDALTSPAAVRAFAKTHRAGITVMEGGEHWFHTDEQMQFLDSWIRKNESDRILREKLCPEVIGFYESDRQAHWLAQIAKSDWRAGAFLHDLLQKDTFFDAVGDHSEVLMVVSGDELIAFCTFAEKDDIQPTELTPWVGFVYTFPAYRGHRFAGLLFDEVERRARQAQIGAVYLSTNHTGLYEKYGFEYLMQLKDIDGVMSRIYVKRFT